MTIRIIAIGFAAALILPITAQAASNCGVPEGYGTSNPYTFNRSTCGTPDNRHSTSNRTKQPEVLTPSGTQKAKPTGYGTTNPYIPNSGAANLGSNTNGN